MMNFTALQKRVVVLGWVTYAAYYLGRVNLATALPAMEADFKWQPEQTSLFAGAILWTYALGQLFNGWLGEKLDPRRMVFAGIAGSLLVNLLMSVVTVYEGLVLLALANGFLQAMGWGPILRTLSDVLADDQRRSIAGFFGASYVIGNTLTWLLTGLLLTGGQWQPLFVIPPLIMFGFGLVWYRLSPSYPAHSRAALDVTWSAVVDAIKRLWVFLFTAIVAGALLNGALFYAPTFIAQVLPLDQAALSAIIFPIFGLLGTAWLSSLILRRTHGHELRALLMMLLLAAAARGLALFVPISPVSALLLLAAMGITSYALTNLLLTAVPLLYAHLGTSLVAGLMDAVHSIGGAIGSTLVGVLLGQGGWSLVFGAWLLLPLLAMVVIFLVSPADKLKRTMPVH
jgi:OPA family glycerol-3-phosphate transporter-like MFS transporter